MERATEVAALLLREAYTTSGRTPDSLLEEDFLSAEVANLTDADAPPIADCCRAIHRRCILTAVNEALEVLAAGPPPPRGATALARVRAPPAPAAAPPWHRCWRRRASSVRPAWAWRS